MSGYAILRLTKIKDVGSIKRLSAHHERTGSKVANAQQPYRANVFTGSGFMAQDVLGRIPEKKKSDAVLAMEIVLTTSPESQRFDDEITGQIDPEKVKKFEAAAQAFLKKEFGGTATTRIHFDETTPHVQGFIVPNEGWESGAGLNAKKLFNPRTLAGYQTKWHAALVAAGLNVQRGEPGSQAKHEPIADYYGRVNSPIKPLPKLAPKAPEPTKTDKIMAAIGVETEQAKADKLRKETELKRIIALEKTYKKNAQVASEAQAQAAQAMDRAKRAEAKLAAAKKSADELRSLPLAEVLQRLGCERHKGDKLRWDTPAGGVWLEVGGQRFNSFDDPALKGRGAIDLVMKINGSTFNDATSWLAGQYGVERTSHDAAGLAVETAAVNVFKAVQAVEKPLGLPTPQPSHLQRVQAYLVQARRVPADLVARLMDAGRIYADRFANAIFKNDDGQGCEIRGTGDKAFHGQRGQKTGFTVDGDPKKVAIVESAIEALSCNAKTGFTSVSVGGSNARQAAEVAQLWLGKGATVYAAQNADPAGEKQAAALMRTVPGVHRLTPMSNDWNDDLKLGQKNTKTPTKNNLAKP